MISTYTTTEIVTFIPGPAGKLELMVASLSKEEEEEKPGAWGIVCHPHPLHGGTMLNKVVTTLTKTFQGLGVSTVRFNFRGVGRSEGEFADGIGEQDDLLAVIDWVQREHKEREIWLAGFSFGSYVVAKASTTIPVATLVTVALPVTHFPMQSLPPITCPWVLVQGELDEVISPAAVFKWAESRVPPPIILRFPDAGHFFHGQLGQLRERLAWVLSG